MKHFIAVISLLIGFAVLAADVSFSYTMAEPSLKVSDEYTFVRLDGAQSWGTPGEPELPWFGTKILLQPGEEALEIQVSLSQPQVFTLERPVAPLQQQHPLSSPVQHPRTQPNPAIYENPGFWPQLAHNGVNTQFLSGHPINFSAVCPFEYEPQTAQLTFYRRIDITVRTSGGSRSNEALRILKQDASVLEQLASSVDNRIDIPKYSTRQSGYDYLIIHDADKFDQWQPIKAFHSQRGLNVMMKSVQEIQSGFAGQDLQEKIRNFIISVYQNNPLRHVLLSGDTDVIPHRGFYVNMGSGADYVDYDIPADMYYSCLDGNWNTNGNNLWGEPTEADLVPELSIGRFCYNNDTEIQSFIHKTTSYLTQPVISDMKTSLFVGEWLWDGPTWGGDYMDEMIGGSSMNGYTTVGVPTNWNISTLYDRTYGQADSWTGSQVRPLLSQGPNLVNHLGHSFTNYCMRLNNQAVTANSITNNGTDQNYSIYFSQGCYAGSFDNRESNAGQYTSDSITEKFTSISTSAVAMISHSRYGWGMQGSTDGASQKIHRQYIDAIFGENLRELGFVLADSKVDNIPFMSNMPVMYWVVYETNLFGDPVLMVWGDTPQEMNVQLPSYWAVGLNNYQILTNAPGAKLRLKNGDELLWESEADNTGMISIALIQPLTPGEYQISIVANDFFVFSETVTVIASDQPYVVASSVDYIDDDGLYHTGELIGVNVTIENVGLMDQLGPGTLSLVSTSPNISILNSSCGFDPLQASDAQSIEGFFQIRILGEYPDKHIATMNFVASFDSHQATTPVTLMLNAPKLNLDTYEFVSSNLMVMPGDNAGLNLILSNTGSGQAFFPMLILFSDNPLVNLSQFDIGLDPILPNDLILCENVVTITVSEDMPIGSSANIGYLITAENGNVLEGVFSLYVGNQKYTFEHDQQEWISYPLLANFSDQWHRNNNRTNTQGGSWSMKFGGPGSSGYASSAHGALESSVIPLGQNGRLYFHHWMDAEVHNNSTHAWDGGLVELSIDDGPWVQIEPVGGYPRMIYSNPASPFAANTQVYSGSFGWTPAEFDLSQYSGNARVRFVFGSDGYVSGEGWYIDDVYIESEFVVAADDPVQTVQFELFGNYPNPFNPSTTIRFDLPLRSTVNLDIFNLRGQKICSLVDSELPAGTHRAVWNGLDDQGRPVSSGVYLYRLSDSKNTTTKKMMLMK